MDQTCPIWSTPSAIGGVQGGRLDLTSVNSPRAGGNYAVEDTAKNKLSTLNERDKVKLTSWLDEQRRFGILTPIITRDSIIEVQNRKELRITERVDGILRYLESKLRGLGKYVEIYLFRSVATRN